MKKWLPWIIVAVFAAWVAGSLRMPAGKDFDWNGFGRLPVVFNGRTQPLDSVARNALLQLREKQTANLEPWKSWHESPKIISATEWLATVMTKPEQADEWPVFRIDHPDVKGLLGLPGEADAARQQDGKHFSWRQIQPKLADLRREAARADEVEASRRSTYDQALLKLWSAQSMYHRLKFTLGPAGAGNLAADLAPFLQKIDAGRVADEARASKQPFDDGAWDWLAEQGMTPLVAAGGRNGSHDQWMRAAEAAFQAGAAGPEHFSLSAYSDISRAYRAGQPQEFNAAVAAYQSQLADHAFTAELKKAGQEQLFNYIEPFYKGMVLFVCAFLFVLAYWFRPGRWEWLRLTALGLVVLALVVHTGGLLFRMYLEGRPPVTNLYSSAIFIGWGATVLGLILELFWRNSIGLMVSCVIGFTTLLIAHNLGTNGDTMEMMQAVLDTNFWLATHVVVVTLGYASTFVAGILGIIYIIMGVFTKQLSAKLSPDVATGAGFAAAGVAGALVARRSAQLGDNIGKSLNRMIYGILCFATLFSFVGTVLGGIWADQSWGRFWGWDVKENGALIIVLWNALVLHARWGGMVRERGLAVLAVAGNIVTSWSWFGVNMLGIGLHSYGFTSAAFTLLMLFIGFNLLLIALGSLPLHLWASHSAATPPPGPEPKRKTVPAT